MVKVDPRLREKFASDFRLYAEHCLKIRGEEGDLVPLKLKKAQLILLDFINQDIKKKGFVRLIVLKGRQLGSSTEIEGIFFQETTFRTGVRAFILTHSEQATNNLFDMAKRYYENCPEPFRPSIKSSNAKELIFDKLDSGYKIGTAGNKSVGRSSTIQLLHASEAAFFQHAEEHAKGILQAVPRAKGTMIIVESTANGMGNWFHQLWQEAVAGTSEFTPVFLPWYWDEKYQATVPNDFEPTADENTLKELYGLTDAQLVWRRIKIKDFSVLGTDGLKGFQQEYPNCATEAFVTSGASAFISPDLVMHARKVQGIEPYGPLIIGVDPAWDKETSDRTAIAWRRGRVIEKVDAHRRKDNMAIVGIIHEIILRDKPAAVNIDVGGGTGIIDRLIELGHGEIVNAINFGERAILTHIYANRRIEMWDAVRKELETGLLKIPDDDEIHADLCAPQIIGPDSAGRQRLESKIDIKVRYKRSPDKGDSIALTYAIPIAAYQDRMPEKVLVRGVWV